MLQKRNWQPFFCTLFLHHCTVVVIHYPVTTCPLRKHLFVKYFLIFAIGLNSSRDLIYRYISIKSLASPLPSKNNKKTKKGKEGKKLAWKQVSKVLNAKCNKLLFFLYENHPDLLVHCLGCNVTPSDIYVADLIGRLLLKGVSFSCWRWAAICYWSYNKGLLPLCRWRIDCIINSGMVWNSECSLPI